MLQYLYFCSHGYYSVCQSVFYELLCNIARHAMKKMKINKNKLFLPRAYFCQTATGNIDIVGLTHAVFVCVCDASLHQFSCLTRDSRPAKCWERRGRKTRWLLIIIQTTLNPSMLMMTMMMTASWRRKMRWLSYCVLMSVCIVVVVVVVVVLVVVVVVAASWCQSTDDVQKSFHAASRASSRRMSVMMTRVSINQSIRDF